ncbi:Uncharacterised protein [uncultured Clostridium sp.]|nr:Uncharacterised protein [uncultured Clostridium sp.]
MIIGNDLLNLILEIDNSSSSSIANIFKSKLDNIVLTGFPLSDSFAYGYLKCGKLVIKLLEDNTESKKSIIKYINELNLSSYNNYSCNSCFNNGFIQCINQLQIELSNYSDISSS